MKSNNKKYETVDFVRDISLDIRLSKVLANILLVKRNQEQGIVHIDLAIDGLKECINAKPPVTVQNHPKAIRSYTEQLRLNAPETALIKGVLHNEHEGVIHILVLSRDRMKERLLDKTTAKED